MHKAAAVMSTRWQCRYVCVSPANACKDVQGLTVCLSVCLSSYLSHVAASIIWHNVKSHHLVFYQPLFSFFKLTLSHFHACHLYNFRFVFCSWKNWTTTIFSRSSERALNPELFAIWCSVVAVVPFRWVTSRVTWRAQSIKRNYKHIWKRTENEQPVSAGCQIRVSIRKTVLRQRENNL